MAELFIGPVIETLTTEVLSSILNLRGLGKARQEMQEWHHLLTEISTVRKDHEEMRYTNDRLISWHQDLNILAEDIRDAVDALKEDTEQRGIFRRMKKFMKPYSTLEEERKEITRRIRLMYERKQMLDRAKESDEEIPRLRTGPAPAERKLFGREIEKEKIIDLLNVPSSYSDYGYDFISIVGMGGIGKSTLAQHVYKDVEVSSFPVRAWISVSIEYNPCEMYRSIIEQITGQCNINDSIAMQEMLRVLLMGKKFLIVLDDYWSQSMREFDTLRAPFMDAKLGSKFIITTRNRAVAKRFTAEENIIDLGLMSKEDCWSLFCSNSRLEINSNPNLVTIGKEICEKCDGLPLSVVIMRGILSGIDEEAGWRAVLNDNKFANGDVHSIMRTSYRNLPDQLKKCFSFCTIFPKGHLFDRQSTVNLWMLAGIIERDNQSKEEDFGGRCFDELVSRSLLTRFFNDYGYLMHDIIRATGKQVSGEIYCNWEEEVGAWEKIRHLSISKQMISIALENLKSFPKEMLQLRTLIIDGENYNHTDDMDFLFSKVKHLRVLKMRNFKISKISKYWCQMKFLQMLELRNFNELKKVPIITEFTNLVELEISECKSLTGHLPPDLSRLVRLKKLVITFCEGLTGPIPPELGRLTNLKSLVIWNCYGLTGPIPPELGRLTNLITLYICHCDGLTGPIPPELGRLTNLITLDISRCDGLTGSIPPEFGAVNMLYEFGYQIGLSTCDNLPARIPPHGLASVTSRLTGFSKATWSKFTAFDTPFLLSVIEEEISSMDGKAFPETSTTTTHCFTVPTGPIRPEFGALTTLNEINLLSCEGLKEPILSELGLNMLKHIKLQNCESQIESNPSELGGLMELKLAIKEFVKRTIPSDLIITMLNNYVK